VKIVSRTPETWHQGYKDGVTDCSLAILQAISEIRKCAGMAGPEAAVYIDLTCDTLIDALIEFDFIEANN
jgi:hypothetical protein